MSFPPPDAPLPDGFDAGTDPTISWLLNGGLTSGAGGSGPLGPKHASHANAMRVFKHDPRIALWIKYNRFAHRVEICGQPYIDSMASDINLWLATEYAIPLAKPEITCKALHDVARTYHSYDPLEDYLRALTWDGRPRLAALLVRGFRVETPEDQGDVRGVDLVARLSRCMLIGAVARALKPGCKVDTQVVLVGGQGVNKSRGLAALCPRPEWFADTHIDMMNKDMFMQLSGKWLYENAEMSAIKRIDIEKVKSYLSSSTDNFRLPFARSTEDFPRRCIFVGSTNNEDFLTDDTGSRRFWPLKMEENAEVDVEWITENQDQLWAEAREGYLAEERWWLDKAFARAMAGHSENFRRENPWSEVLHPFLAALDAKHPTGFALNDVRIMLNISAEKWTHALQILIGHALTGHGYRRPRPRGGPTGRIRLYRRPEEEPACTAPPDDLHH